METKPYFKDEAVHFQLVHAGRMVRCAVSRVALIDKYGGVNSPQGLISTYQMNLESIHAKGEGLEHFRWPDRHADQRHALTWC